ncbi:MAG: long-chain fatty acid--CoA ligase [Chloroflexi bacterium]|nr:long-chain fatty acid--CoA ligase [Chloroflexota bacterium]
MSVDEKTAAATGNAAEGASPADRPWLKFYEPGVPHDVEIPNQTLPELLADAAKRWPERVAVGFQGASLTYAEIDALAWRFAHVLLRLGVSPGDRVALLLPNSPQFVFAYYGVMRAGAIVVPTSPLYVQREIEHQLADAGVKVALVLSALYPRVAEARRNLPDLEHVIVTNIKEYFPPLIKVLFTVAKERKDGHNQTLPKDGRTHWLQPLLQAGSSAPLPARGTPHDLAVLQYTGGTTGLAKAAMLSHRNLLANAAQARAWFTNVTRPDGRDTILAAIPLFHIYAMTSVMNLAVLGGARMLLHPKFDLKAVLKALHSERPDLFPGVPTMYMAINNAPGLARYNITSLKACISGAAPLPRDVQTRFEALTGAKLVEGYGLSEASPVTHCTPLTGLRKVGSIGVPFPGTDAAVFDQETGTRRLGIGEVGELAVRGPQVMHGYWNRPEETAEVLRDGWLFTGDLVTVDADGYFSIVDRKKDVILSGGVNVYPRDVEEPLYRHPAVQEAVAVGLPDEYWGEAVKVYIVLKPGHTATVEEIQRYCHAQMASYKVPKYVEFRDSLPKSLVGKFLRRMLLEEEAARTHTGS